MNTTAPMNDEDDEAWNDDSHTTKCIEEETLLLVS
eukprot:CAMPEP_0172496520 /NCGR_PEP_ID=MMETSP1066-20121228/88603_1 /TAXON_ID=671091 /ORGANISM="Coscinodiscus wailesii, Strain CCMP2513" /LENGTH=34 /DNA_ID= /DNA_START= /DNA_END= /DNA_ORIENTATION=